jgi:hypothetical protein
MRFYSHREWQFSRIPSWAHLYVGCRLWSRHYTWRRA